MNDKYAIGMVLYYPEDFSIKRINYLLEKGYSLFIFNNTPKKNYKDKIVSKCKDSLFFVEGGKNFGLGVALSLLCSNAQSYGFKFLFFLDQDTLITDETLIFIHNTIRKIEEVDSYSIIQFRNDNISNPTPKFIEEVAITISSGSLFHLENLCDLGGHNENYFVEGVDYEISIRSTINGLKLGLVENTPGFDHKTYQADSTVELFNKKIRLRKHNAKRFFDTLTFYRKIFLFCFFHFKMKYMILISRSMIIYLRGQFLSYIILTQKQEK